MQLGGQSALFGGSGSNALQKAVQGTAGFVVHPQQWPGQSQPGQHQQNLMPMVQPPVMPPVLPGWLPVVQPTMQLGGGGKGKQGGGKGGKGYMQQAMISFGLAEGVLGQRCPANLRGVMVPLPTRCGFRSRGRHFRIRRGRRWQGWQQRHASAAGRYLRSVRCRTRPTPAARWWRFKVPRPREEL